MRFQTSNNMRFRIEVLSLFINDLFLSLIANWLIEFLTSVDCKDRRNFMKMVKDIFAIFLKFRFSYRQFTAAYCQHVWVFKNVWKSSLNYNTWTTLCVAGLRSRVGSLTLLPTSHGLRIITLSPASLSTTATFLRAFTPVVPLTRDRILMLPWLHTPPWGTWLCG